MELKYMLKPVLSTILESCINVGNADFGLPLWRYETNMSHKLLAWGQHFFAQLER